MKDIIDKIEEKSKIAILTHISEDADAVCSALALKEACDNMGKTADIYISDNLEERLEFLSGEMIVFEKEKIYPAYELCVCVDCGDLKRLGERIIIFENSECTINIDHHCTNPEYADFNYVLGEASSTGEIIYNLLTKMKVKLTKRIAELLYAAIASDTGSFKYSCTSADTMRAAAKLMELDIDYVNICRCLFDTESRNEMRLKGHIMENIHEYFNGKVCIAVADEKLFKHFGVDEKNIGDLVNIPRRIKGCEIAISVKMIGDKCKISFRSAGKYDVAEFAASLGGGGHKMAAGATISGEIEEIESMLVKKLGKYMNPEEKNNG